MMTSAVIIIVLRRSPVTRRKCGRPRFIAADARCHRRIPVSRSRTIWGMSKRRGRDVLSLCPVRKFAGTTAHQFITFSEMLPVNLFT